MVAWGADAQLQRVPGLAVLVGELEQGGRQALELGLLEAGRLVAAALAGVQGYAVFPTETNFVLVRVPDAGAAFAALRAAGILVKNLHGWHPLLAQCLRITVGTQAENERLIEALGPLL